MFRFVFLLLISALLTQGSFLPDREEALEKEILDVLLQRHEDAVTDPRKCITTDVNDLTVTAPDTPSPLTVNQCENGDLYKTESCVDFDTSDCATTNCVLGYETDVSGCVKSCECKTEGLMEGDIMLSKEDVVELQEEDDSDRAASRSLRRWTNIPQGGGTFIVPYRIDSSITRNPRAVAAISAAMAQYAEQTCIRFVPRINQRDYLDFFKGNGCWSYMGRRGGRQRISIGRGCEWKGVVMHEMMHALGFWHEQSRPDRDSFIQIIIENIKKGAEHNFRKKGTTDVDSMGSPYDVKSLMQYGGYSFARDNRPTIIDRRTRKAVRAQRNGFSVEDVKQLNAMYHCH